MTPSTQQTIAHLFNAPHTNGGIIQGIVLNHVNLDAVFTLLECQQLLSKVLCDCEIIEDTTSAGDQQPPQPDAPKFQDWLQALTAQLSEQKIPLTKATYDALLTLFEDFKLLEKIQALLCNIPNICQEKIDECVTKEQYTDWETIRTWVNTACSQYLDNTQWLDHRSQLYPILSAYIDKTLTHCNQMLDHQLKDHLHATVNHTIILPKILGDTGWKATLHTMQKDPRHFIRECEDTIKADLTDITKNINAPFMDTFYDELYTRCYKQLMAPMAEKENSSSIHRLTSFDISRESLARPKPIPSDIQETLDTAYLALLKSICWQAPDIRAHVTKHPIHVAPIHTQTTDLEQTFLSNFAVNIYRSVRHYERLLSNIETAAIAPEGTLSFLSYYLTHLELSHHAFRPFLVVYIDLLGVFINQQKITQRHYYIHEHNTMIQHLKSVNELRGCLQLLNPYLAQPNTSARETIQKNQDITTFIHAHKDQLSPTSPWNHDVRTTVHTPLCQQIIDVLGLSRRPKKKNRKLTDITEPVPATVSEWLSQPPKST